MNRPLARNAALSLVAAAAAAVVPPLTMTALWALLSGDPAGFLDDIGGGGVVAFVLSEQRFFAPVVLAGLGAHVVFFCLRCFHPLAYAFAFYCIGAVVYFTTSVPQLAAFALDPPVVRTLAFDALLWWGPAAALSGVVFWVIAARPWRRRTR
ncbi:MAG: hypothetical protein JNM75_10320 [Rhodospirillales bacterium]|nr:hypothetical protein [Rhodospirillales bacterium]